MTPEQAKREVKRQLENYLSSKGINTRKNFFCLNPDHHDEKPGGGGKPNMSLDREHHKAHCFKCGATYDTFDLIAIDQGIDQSTKKGQHKMFQKAYKHFNLRVNGHHDGTATPSQSAPDKPKSTGKAPVKPKAPPAPATDYSSYFRAAHARIKATDYPERRGLSEDIVKRFCLGYDPNFTQGTGGETWQALIIPNGKYWGTARNTDPKATANNGKHWKGKRIRKIGREAPIYNGAALKQTERPVFVVEGEIDALSIIEAGGQAVALGSQSNHNKLIYYLQEKGIKPERPLIIAFDNIPDAQARAKELQGKLSELDIAAHVVEICGEYSDPNEALTGDRDALADAIAWAENIEDRERQRLKKEYEKNSVAHHIDAFIDGIADRAATPATPTGFELLCERLDGGLYEGLYIVGAVSSLGKTTFITQIGDAIAQGGRDVLLFSMEMARTELMAKSISRHTLLHCMAQGIPTGKAKTTRGITTGKRYENYSDTEGEVIGQAVADYEAYARHLYIIEGLGQVGADNIRATVKQHISITGTRPVVIVDYLQIIAPHEPRATDKQNTDYAVLELKRISRDFKAPVVAISSLNRQSYKEDISEIAFKESGAIEYSSDLLIGLQFTETGGKDFEPLAAKRRDPREIELKILKNRNGPIGQPIDYNYRPMFNYFYELPEPEQTHKAEMLRH